MTSDEGYSQPLGRAAPLPTCSFWGENTKNPPSPSPVQQDFGKRRKFKLLNQVGSNRDSQNQPGVASAGGSGA